ncbi:MAG: tRNA guanosine(34) transglycosylase Tgt [Saprospiraceae bacterium]|nr:tRNA guanosine(34) transglycosylase Tgt [Saprospiraceae bacterium]
MSQDRFQLIHRAPNSKARAGLLQTAHGAIETPIFMPVGTAATVKAVHQKELQEEVKAQIILSNTYHLHLRPGSELIRLAGGLHQFMSWPMPILTDSGGYQVFSLSERRKIKEEGVTFYSHIDGSRQFFSPESVVDIQRNLGSDFMMALDECPPFPCEQKYAEKSMQLTHRWIQRGQNHFQSTSSIHGHEQIFVPVCQGSVYPDLSIKSAEFISQYDKSVYAIGGLSVGEPENVLYEMVNLETDVLPETGARYLMGVGTPANLLECIDRGIDMFDCVLPSRNARHGIIYTTEGIIHIRNAKWKEDFSPIDRGLTTNTSVQMSKAYLRHLFHSKEILGAQIATLQNLGFYLWLVKEARRHIIDGSFSSWKTKMIEVISLKR